MRDKSVRRTTRQNVYHYITCQPFSTTNLSEINSADRTM